jgi:hypothetical protein
VDSTTTGAFFADWMRRIVNHYALCIKKKGRYVAK